MFLPTPSPELQIGDEVELTYTIWDSLLGSRVIQEQGAIGIVSQVHYMCWFEAGVEHSRVSYYDVCFFENREPDGSRIFGAPEIVMPIMLRKFQVPEVDVLMQRICKRSTILSQPVTPAEPVDVASSSSRDC